MNNQQKENQLKKIIAENNQLKLKNKKTNEIIKKLRSLIDVNSAIVSSLDKREVLKLILKQTKKIMDCKKSSVLLVDSETKELYFEVISEDEDMSALSEIRLKKGEGIAGKVWMTEKPILIKDASKDNRISRKADKKLSGITKSLIAAPLIVKEKVIGVMEAMNKNSDTCFNQQDFEIFMTLSHQVAIAIYNSQLYEMAIKDSMTKLFIKKYFCDRLAEEFNRSKRYNRDLSLVMFDIDHFKKFNDTYGHQFGDVVLIQTATIINEYCRSSDIPARYGGEEFSVILPETNRERAFIMADRIRIIIERKDLFFQNMKVNLTISGGISSLMDNHPDLPDDLINMADQALYRSKENGRNQITIIN